MLTGTRAEYGLLRYLMQAIRRAPDLDLQIIVTGMHLSPEFGLTYRDIEADGFTIDRKVEMLLSSDTPVGIGKATGLGMIGFADALQVLSPDLLVVLGDRFEVLGAVIAALYARLPVAHIHGGETTAGAFDEGIRHAITKMSHLHFVAAEEYRRRVVQLGEDPSRVHLVGGLGVDGIQRSSLLERDQLAEDLGIDFSGRSLLITFHPVTLEDASAESQFAMLLAALEKLDQDIRIVFTLPNADTNGRELIEMVHNFVERHSARAVAFTSLGQRRYWSLMKVVDVVVGNSSSGLLEAPTLKTATVNIGARQAGRLSCESIIDCEPETASIHQAIQKALSERFRACCRSVVNPYGLGGATEKILEELRAVTLDQQLIMKRFYDLPASYDHKSMHSAAATTEG